MPVDARRALQARPLQGLDHRSCEPPGAFVASEIRKSDQYLAAPIRSRRDSETAGHLVAIGPSL